MSTFRNLITSPIFISSVLAWFSAQFLKSVIAVFRTRAKVPKKDLLMTLIWTTGGMPSSHSAVVSALSVSVGFKVGFDSPLFIACLFLSGLAIRDALGVRQATGNQARVINQIIKDMNERMGCQYKPVKEINGHKPPEVVVGILLGIFLAIAICAQ